jgi:hypothetical protein
MLIGPGRTGVHMISCGFCEFLKGPKACEETGSTPASRWWQCVRCPLHQNIFESCVLLQCCCAREVNFSLSGEYARIIVLAGDQHICGDRIANRFVPTDL